MKRVNSSPAVAFALSLLLLLPGVALSGANETPGQNYRPHTFSSFSANLWEFGAVDVGIFQGIVVNSQHYTQGATYADNAHDLTSGGGGIWNFFTFCTNRAADVMLVTSHGWNDPTTTVEAYPWSVRGRAVRDSVLAYYNGIFAAGSFIARNWANHYYGIDATQTFYTTYFMTPQAFCWWATCWSSLLNMTGPAEARCYLGYDQVVWSTKCYCDERRVLQRMDGQEGQGMRPLGAALANINGLCPPGGARLRSQGRLNTVLSPSVLANAPVGIVCGPTPGFVHFDCTMDRTVAPSSVVVAYGNGYLTNHQWAGDDRITFDVIPVGPCPTILYDVKEPLARSFADRARLDGNTNPQVNALGPNQDDYIWMTWCPYCPVPVTTPDPTNVPDDPAPGEKTQAVIALSNNTDDVVTVQVEVTDLMGWVATPPQLLTLAAREGRLAFFDIFVSPAALPGTADPYTVMITGAGDPVTASGQVVVGSRLRARLASSDIVGAGQPNQVNVLVENRTGSPVQVTDIALDDGLGWPILPLTTALDLGPAQTALASFSVQVPPGTLPGTTNPLTFRGTIETEIIPMTLTSIRVGLPLEVLNLNPIDVVPGNLDARIEFDVRNPGALPLNGITWVATDTEGLFSDLSVLAPPNLPPASMTPGRIIGGLSVDPSLIGRSGALMLHGQDPSGATFETSVPYTIEPAVEIAGWPPNPCTGFSDPHDFPWMITLRNRSDVPLNGSVLLNATGVGVFPPSLPLSLGPNDLMTVPAQLTVMPDFPPGEQTAMVQVQTMPATGSTRGSFEFAVTNPVVVHMVAREMSGSEGTDLLVKGTVRNLRTDQPMAGTLQWADERGWLLPPLFGTYNLPPGGEDSIAVTVQIPGTTLLRDAPVDSNRISVEITMTYDTGLIAQERAEIILRVFEQNPLDVPPADAVAAGDGIERVTPNPFLPSARIDFRLAAAGMAKITVFDAAGRSVAVLADGLLPAGPQARVWDGRTQAGATAPAGVYFIRLETSRGSWTKKLIRLR